MAASARPLPPPAPSSGAAVALSRRERIAALTGVLLALLLAALDQTIVSTAGPAIQRDLQVAPATYPWITTAYLVASTVMVPIYGKLSDLYGRKPVLLVGVSIFLAGSFLCGISPNVSALVAARAVQGLGAAALFTSAFTVIADIFPPAERGKYAGFIGGVMGIASVVGPLVGGVLTDTLGWHWVFFVNLPVGAVAIWFITRRMPALHTSAAASGARPRIDFAGAAALVVAVVPFLVALSLGRSAESPTLDGYAWSSGLVLGLFAVAALGAAAFLVAERRAADPILDLRLFRSRSVGLGTAAVFVLGAAFLSAVVFLPLYLVNVIGVSATRAGLTMMPLTLGVVTGSIGSGQLIARTGRYRRLMLLALCVLTVGFTVMGFTLTAESSQLEVTLKMVLVGLGVGPTFPIYTLIVQNASDPRDLGVVTAALTFARSLGQVTGVAVFGTIFAATLTGSLAYRIGTAVEGLPAATRELVAPLAPGGGIAGGQREASGAVAFDAVRAREQIMRAVPSPARAAALEALDRVGAGVRHAFTDATRHLYQIGIGLALAALLLSIGIPEIPLRRHHGLPPSAPME